MIRYSEKFKESIIQKMMPPNNVPVSKLVRDTGISDVTLYNWRKNAISKGVPVAGDGKNPGQWTAANKLAVIIETAALNEVEIAEYCRKKGLFTEQIQQWKEAIISTAPDRLENLTKQRKAMSEAQKKDKKTIKKLERELHRKDKALAEAAALLVLTKKAQEIWGVAEDD